MAETKKQKKAGAEIAKAIGGRLIVRIERHKIGSANDWIDGEIEAIHYADVTRVDSGGGYEKRIGSRSWADESIKVGETRVEKEVMLSPLTKRIVIAVATLGVIALLRFKPWQTQVAATAREKLTVGFLPVT